MIIDHKVNRQPYRPTALLLKPLTVYTMNVQSGPGYISKEARQAIKFWASQQRLQGDALQRASERPWVIEVDGEEDLLALPAVVDAPPSSVVYYGQPPIPAWACGPQMQGLVEVEVSEDKKAEAGYLLKQFTSEHRG